MIRYVEDGRFLKKKELLLLLFFFEILNLPHFQFLKRVYNGRVYLFHFHMVFLRV